MKKLQQYLPWIVLVFALLYAGQKIARPEHIDSPFDLDTFRQLPVSANGRTKPLDTVARNSLMNLSGRQSIRSYGETTTAIEWYIELITNPEASADRRVFRIDHPDVLAIVGLEARKPPRFAFEELRPSFNEVNRQAGLAFATKAKKRDPFQNAVLVLNQRLMLYSDLTQLDNPYLVPPITSGDDWRSFVSVLTENPSDPDALALLDILQAYRAGNAADNRDAIAILELLQAFRDSIIDDMADDKAKVISSLLRTYRDADQDAPGNLIPNLLQAYRDYDPDNYSDFIFEENPNNNSNAEAVIGLLQDHLDYYPKAFNTGLEKFAGAINTKLGYDARKSRYEVTFNQVQPFITASALYLMAFLFGCFGLLFSQLTKQEWSKTLLRSMTALIVVAFIVHTVGIVSRVYLQGRPPITNLYSSAIFIGWFGIIIGLILDRQNKLGLGGIMASVIGFGTLIIAHNLGSSGDTMEMMQAVLDSNFWLATHVVVVTIGYSATFFAGFLAIAYVFLGVFTPTLDRERGKSMIKMVYGVICFATVTSFVGTVLGGIWADQSWGRFWGWDAKENGAALIVLWNLLILHARWGGMIRDRGLVNLAIFGNIITAWSWFGTNMLGVGLHSYGFTESAVFWISVFVLSQLIIIGIGLLPLTLWRSKFARPAPSES